jgi:predicted Zn-dependent protease
VTGRAAATTVVLVPIHLGSEEVRLTELRARLARGLRADVRVVQPPFDPEETFDRGRGQYNSTALLRRLLDAEIEHGDRLLGVAGVDLFIPVLTYVFG